MANKSSTISGCGRVDTHHHCLPASIPELEEFEVGGPIPMDNLPRTPQDHLKFMDEHEIQTAVLSASILARFGELPAAEHLDLCERTWAAQQEYIKVNPLRFGSFAMLPFPNVNETLKFVENAGRGSIIPDGYTVGTSLGGRYLGDGIFEPVWAALDKIHATVFVHPVDTLMPPNLTLPAFLLEFPFDTARCLFSIIVSGVLTRYQNVRFIFSHNGGAYPYVSHRAAPIDKLIRAKNNQKSANDLMSTANIFFDTALSYKTQFPLVKELGLPTEHILYGSDHPYTSAVNNESFMLASESPALSGSLSDEDCNVKIARENALNLFPRLQKLYKEEFPELYREL